MVSSNVLSIKYRPVPRSNVCHANRQEETKASNQGEQTLGKSTNSWGRKLYGLRGGGGGGGGVSKSADCTSLFLITLIEPAHNEVARNVTSFH